MSQLTVNSQQIITAAKGVMKTQEGTDKHWESDGSYAQAIYVEMARAAFIAVGIYIVDDENLNHYHEALKAGVGEHYDWNVGLT